MKITVLKSTIETALTSILKILVNAKLPKDINPALTFKSDKQILWIQCTLSEQQISVALSEAVFDEKNSSFDVNLYMFRRLLATAKGTHFSIEKNPATVVLNCDDCFIGQLVPMSTKEPAKFQIPINADATVLPTNFADFIQKAFKCTSTNEDSTALIGVNISSRGIAGTDGKQLFHLPLPLQLKDDVTIPPLRIYEILKNFRWKTFTHWRTIDNARMFSIIGDGFRYTSKAIEAPYPSYWQIFPNIGQNDVTFTLSAESALSLRKSIDKINDETIIELTVYRDRIELLEVEDKKQNERIGKFDAKCTSANIPCTVCIKTCYLKQFLMMGYLSMSLSSKTQNLLGSASGIGKYLFMPYGVPNSAKTSTTPAPESENKKTTISNSQTNKPYNQPNNNHSEKATMTQTTNNTISPTANNTTASINTQSDTNSNLLKDTLASIASMRDQLSALDAGLREAGRKIKAALNEQRQKDHLYANANRKLKQIRLAV